MAVITEIPQHYQDQLAVGWHYLVSQEKNRLSRFCTMKQLKGKLTLVDQIGTVEMEEKIGRMGTTVPDEMPLSKRAVIAREFAKSIGFDEFDEDKMTLQNLPIAETQKRLFEAAERKSEQVIIDGISGTNYEGENGTTAVEIPSSQIIPVNFYKTGLGANTGLTYDKFVRLKRLAMENEVFGKEVESGADKLCMALSAGQIEDLLHDLKVINNDYASRLESVQHGEVNEFLGVEIVRTQQLPITDIGGGELHRDVFAWVKSGVCFGFRNNYSSRMVIRDDLDETIQIRGKVACGAARLEEEKVWKLPCLEA